MELWLENLSKGCEAADRDDIFGEVLSLIGALEKHGMDLGDPESHPVVTSNYELHALRRTPPSATAPLATDPPILRLLYCYCEDEDGQPVALLVVGGNKTVLKNSWYPPNRDLAEKLTRQWCDQQVGRKPMIRKGTRR